MGKPEPQARPPNGPVRLESGTRVIAVRLPTPQTPSSLPPPPEARDLMPTRELDVAELRKMALKCASDVDADVVAQAFPEGHAKRLELLLDEEEPARAPSYDEEPVELPRRAGRALLAFVLVVAVVAVAIWLYATWAGLI